MLLNNVLVVGSEGFIGSRLMKQHPDWKGIDLKNTFVDDFRHGEYKGYDGIVMLAAHHINFTPEDYIYNLELYRALTKFVLDNDNPFVLFASSAAVYEPSVEGDHQEDEFLRPVTLYGKSKVVGEQIVQDVTDKFTILRFSNVYGDGDGHGAIDLFKQGGNTIYGDGQQVRDYIYVDRIVTAIGRVMASPQRYVGQIYNVSSGVGRTTEHVFNQYGRGKAKYVEPRKADVACSILNNARAKKDGLL